MLAYAANVPQTAGRASSPKALALIIAAHAVALAAVMTAKPELIGLPPDKPPIVINIPNDPPPPPEPQPTTEAQTNQPITQPTFIDEPTTIVPMDMAGLSFDQGNAIEDIATVIGADVQPPPLDLPKAPVKRAAVFRTSESALKPPYPLDKRRLGEEATLKLRLTIDSRGRVTAVEPIGTADLSFLEVARRHILRAWRYQPATEDGVAVPSSTVISLSFRLEDV